MQNKKWLKGKHSLLRWNKKNIKKTSKEAQKQSISAEPEGRYGVLIITCMMANLQSSLQEIWETGVIANTCWSLSLSS